MSKSVQHSTNLENHCYRIVTGASLFQGRFLGGSRDAGPGAVSIDRAANKAEKILA
jgi:hypothetical protein